MKRLYYLSSHSCAKQITTKIIELMFLMFIGVTATNAQTYFPQCNQPDSEDSSVFRKGGAPQTDFTYTQIGGIWKPSLTPDNTFLRVLVVFVRFQDDNETSTIWPTPTVLPNWAEHIVDTSTATIGSTDPENISVYYKRNSYGRFNLIGDVEYVTLPQVEDEYHRLTPNIARGRILRQALDEIHLRYIARGIDFTRYDNWRSQQNSHQFRPNGPDYLSDNRIDMVWLISRNYHVPPQNSGIPDFSTNQAALWVEGNPIYDGVQVISSVRDCGLTMIEPWIYGIVHIQDADNNGIHGSSIIGTAIHEMTHFFFAGLHFGNADAVHSSYFVPYAANAGNCYGHHLGYEKYRLGWIDASQIRTIDPSLISSTTTLYDIADQDVSKTKLIEIIVEDPNTPQRIVLENRGWDIFETQFAPGNGMQAPLNQGILAYHLRNENQILENTFGQILCADGSHDWKLVTNNNGLYDQDLHELEVVDKESPNPFNGYDEKQKIYITDPVTHQLYNRNWIAGFWPTPPELESARGPYPKATNFKNLTTPINDNVGDKYDLFSTGAVISPFSNPPTKRWNATLSRFDTTNLAIEILSYNPLDHSYEIRVVRQNFNDLRPSRPIGLRFDTTNIGQCPHVIWDRNREQDVDSTAFPGQYRLERSIDGAPFSEVAILVHPANEFYDNYSSLGDGIHVIKYRLRVEDNTNQLSEYSDEIEIHVARGTLTSGNTPSIYNNKSLFIVDDVTIIDLNLDIQGFTLLYFCPNTHIYVYSSLTLDQVEMNNESYIECMSSGIVTINDNARVDKLKTLIVQAGGRLFINNQSITKMESGGQITIKQYGLMTVNPTQWTKLQSYYPNPYDGQSYQETKSWKGFLFETNSSVSMSHAIINGAQQALRTNDTRPSISNCTITMNQMGVYSYGETPQLTNNIISSNAYAGCVGFYHYMTSGTTGNRFNKNNFAGAHLFECADLWQDNRLDSNGIGVYAGQGVTVAFNAFTQSGECDTTQGNSVRWNGVGLMLEGFSYPTFECDNSVWGNTQLDIQFNNSGLIGWANFEDIANIQWDVLPGSQLLGFDWLGPYPVTDPVLRKLIGTDNKKIDSLGGEPEFRNSISSARELQRQRQYIPAISQYKNALTHVKNKNQAELCIRLWHQTFIDAIYRDTLNNPVKQERERIEFEFDDKLRDLSKNSDSLWMKRISTFLLANSYQREKKYAGSIELYLDLLQDTLIEPELERRTLISLIVVQHYGLNDYNSAYSTYLYLKDKYPRTKAVVQAKVALLLPVTDDDIAILRDQQKDSLAQKPEPIIKIQNDASFLSAIYPNPFNPSTTLQYKIPSEGYVTVRIYTTIGSLVYERDLGLKPSGISSHNLNAEQLPGGMYFYKLEYNKLDSYQSQISIGKLILTK